MSTISIEELLDRDGQIIYTNKGVSMMPLLRQDKDLLIIKKRGLEPLKKLDVVLFKRRKDNSKDAYVLHRILEVYDDSYLIIGDNCIGKEIVKDENILGILVGIIRNNKQINFDSFLYKLYINTWCRFYHLRIFILRVKLFIKNILRKIYRLFIKKKA